MHRPITLHELSELINLDKSCTLRIASDYFYFMLTLNGNATHVFPS